ncbi:spore germination protein [Effusibacillus dendaii]
MKQPNFDVQKDKQSQNSLPKANQSEFPLELTPQLEQNLQTIKQAIGQNPDVIIRQMEIGSNRIKSSIVYVDNLVDKQTIQSDILRVLLLEWPELQKTDLNSDLPELATYIEQHAVSASETKIGNTLDTLCLSVLSGDTVLLLDGSKEFLVIGSRKYPARSIEEPESESVVRGPREGFIESIRTNLALVRLRIKDTNLTFQSNFIGRRGKKEVVVSYIKGIARQELVDEVNKRLACIDIDDVEESGQLEQLIEDNVFSPFPQAQHTERPDRVASALLQGKVAIFLDGTPFVLYVPVTFSELLKSPEDKYERWMMGSLIRALRYVTAFIAVFLPSLYIALVSFHPGLIPTKLALSIAASREGVPFPALVEAFVMEVTIEVLREAGVRLPKPVGQTVGIVGGLVIGEAAVQAGIVSPIMVIIVALGAISSFSIPSYSVAIAFRILRFLMMLAAAVLGLYGVIIAYILLNIHLVRMHSFGTVFSTPFGPYKLRDWKDLIMRFPLQLIKKRPASLKSEDEWRMS